MWPRCQLRGLTSKPQDFQNLENARGMLIVFTGINISCYRTCRQVLKPNAKQKAAFKASRQRLHFTLHPTIIRQRRDRDELSEEGFGFNHSMRSTNKLGQSLGEHIWRNLPGSGGQTLALSSE